MARVVEGYWDCPYCKTKKIGGLTRNCPNCAKPRGVDTVFYMEGEKRYLSNEEVKKVGTDPDWLCEYCDTLNSSKVCNCKNCGSPRDSKNKNYFNMRTKENPTISQPKNFPTNEDRLQTYRTIVEEKPKHNPAKDVHPPKLPVKLERGLTFGEIITENKSWFIGGAIVLAVILLAVLLFVPHRVTGIIQDFEWSRSIEIQEYKTIRESGWSVPDGGRLQYTKREIHHYDKVLDHYETKTRTYTVSVLDHYDTHTSYTNNGNGTFTEHSYQTPVYRSETRTETYQDPVYRNDPVYATKYYYDIERWVHKTNVKTSGNDHSPYWGEYEFAKNEREGQRASSYVIVVIDEKQNIKEYTVDYDLWKTFTKHETVHLKVYFGGRAVLDIE